MAGLQIILFDVGGIACALRRSAARELLPLPRLWRPPGTPRPVAGFFNLSGTAVPVIRLDILFGLERNKTADAEADLYRHLILVDGLTASGRAALLVDRVLDVLQVEESTLSAVAPENTLNGCVEAEITHAGGLIHLLSIERVLLAEEQQALTELGRHAQSRLGEWALPA
jgi:purine-binding chemotaxis protein CheW